MSAEPPRLAVYGASGVAGSALARALVAAGARVRWVGRSRERLTEAMASCPGARPEELALAAADDRAALIAAFSGAAVVVNAAGPFAEVGDEVLAAAIAAGCHYLDLCAEQAVLRHVFERFDAAARHAEVAVVPGAGLACALGDLLAAAAAARLLEHQDEGPTVRSAPGARLGGEPPLTLAIGYLFDDLALPAGAQASVFANLGAPMVVWRRDRWDPERPGRRTRAFNPGPPPPASELAPERARGADPRSAEAAPAPPAVAPTLAERDAFSLGGGDTITVPRHVAAWSIDTYLSLSRKAPVQGALRLAALAASWLPASASRLLVPSPIDAAALAATRFAVIATAEHPFDARHVVAHGRDLYATSTVITCRLALALANREQGPTGVRAPAELVRAPAFLAELAADHVLVLH